MATNAIRRILSRSSSATTRWMSTSTPTQTPVASKESDSTLLYRKLIGLAIGGSSGENVADALDEWVKGGNDFKRYHVVRCVYQFRKLKKYDHAIQLYEWLDKSKSHLKNADAAVRIDLIAKTAGITAAEDYFNSLERTAQTKKTYGALLSCYCREKVVEKAEELFQKMSELNIHANSINYNNMMSLYVNAGQPEKVPSLFNEMEKNIVVPDLHTYNLLINSYAAAKDLEAVGTVVKLMKKKNVEIDWFTYGNIATIYVNAGLIDKANSALKKVEKMKNLKDPEAFHTMIRLYGITFNKDGVERAWEALKSTFEKPKNLSYLMLLLALSRLGDVDGLEKYFREWESSASNYDIRIPNVLLESYLKRDMVVKANLIIESIYKRGTEPNLTTLNLLMNFHLKKREVHSALEYLEAGASKVVSGSHRWFPKAESVNAFVAYIEEKKDGDLALNFSDILKKIGRLDSETEKRLNSVS